MKTPSSAPFQIVSTVQGLGVAQSRQSHLLYPLPGLGEQSILLPEPLDLGGASANVSFPISGSVCAFWCRSFGRGVLGGWTDRRAISQRGWQGKTLAINQLIKMQAIEWLN
ncbi:hypothetical protein BaRGS_00017025 [Batillaria attramentaria]|uniref:Uncharacterized protein n=1 Tax=Batillaria attramentaria TaxID=370345 RepID=A0ABD0KY67_9CAEN